MISLLFVISLQSTGLAVPAVQLPEQVLEITPPWSIKRYDRYCASTTIFDGDPKPVLTLLHRIDGKWGLSLASTAIPNPVSEAEPDFRLVLDADVVAPYAPAFHPEDRKKSFPPHIAGGLSGSEANMVRRAAGMRVFVDGTEIAALSMSGSAKAMANLEDCVRKILQ